MNKLLAIFVLLLFITTPIAYAEEASETQQLDVESGQDTDVKEAPEEVSVTKAVSGAEYRSYLHGAKTPESLPAEGAFAADPHTGAATFNYPIKVPQGTNGLTPVLALSFSSFAMNAYPELVGSGWTLTETYVERDVEYTPSDNSDDTYRLNFHGTSYHLVNTGSNLYKTERDQGLYVKKETTGWIVKTKDGTMYKLGVNADSTLNANTHGGVYRWYLAEVEDTNNNKIYYDYLENPYTEDMGVKYLNNIEYNNDRSRRISFSYQDLPETWPVYQEGHKVRRDRRLNQIDISVESNVFRTYKIGYTTNEVGTRSYINKIQEFSGTDSLPETEFSYSSITPGWEYSVELTADMPSLEFGDDGGDGGARATDINRDGLIDVIASNNGYQFLSNGDGTFTRVQTWDFPDIADFYESYSGIHLDAGLRLADVDGDNFPDLIQNFDDDNDDRFENIWLNTGSGWQLQSFHFPYEIADIDDVGGIIEYTDRGYRFVDLNGDKKVDSVRNKDTYSKRGLIGTGSGWTSVDAWEPPSDMEFIDADGDDEWGVRITDLNGDGLPDLYKSEYDGTKKVYLNDGWGWAASNDIIVSNLPRNVDAGDDDEGVRFFDVNRDGLPDVIRGDSSARESYLGAGDRFIATSDWRLPENAEFMQDGGRRNAGTRVMDLNGDGAADIIRNENFEGANIELAWVSRASKPILLEQITLPSGGRILIDYISSTDTNDNNMGFNQWIVSAVSEVVNDNHNDPSVVQQCTPSSCPSGFEDNGVSCSGNTCTRLCQVRGCGTYNNVMDEDMSWNEEDFMIIGKNSDNKTIDNTTSTVKLLEKWSGSRLLEFTEFQSNHCYIVTTWSDDNVVSNSDIDHEDTSLTDAVLALSWEMYPLNIQPWGGDCELEANGDVMDNEYYYLIDDADSGDDFDSAGDLEGRWTGYCMPQTVGCGDLEPCTTQCFGNDWEFRIDQEEEIEDGYQKLDPDDPDGACWAQRASGSDADTDYIRFDGSKYYGMIVEEAPYTVINSDNQVCSAPDVKKTTYEYSGGFYDYEEDEFRGFAQVTEYKPNGIKTVRNYYQDDQRAGHTSSVKTYDGNKKLKEEVFIYNIRSAAKPYDVVLQNHKIKHFEGLSSSTDTSTSYEYDQYLNPTIIEHEGITDFSGDEYFEYYSYVYDSTDHIVNKISQREIKNNANSVISRTSYDYDIKGNLRVITEWNDKGADPVTEYEYDSFGNANKIIDANNHETTYTYDSTGTYPRTETNDLGHTTTYDYDLAFGSLLSMQDANGFKTEYRYDEFGRITAEIMPYDDSTYPTVEYEYDFDSNFPERVTVKEKETGSNYFVSNQYYDGFGKLVQENTEAEPSGFIFVDYFYGANNRLKQTNNPYIRSTEAYSSPSISRDATEYEYDAANRITKIINPDKTEIEISYDKLLVTIYDEKDNRVRYYYDGFGNIKKVREYNSAFYDTDYEYDERQLLTQIQDSEGNKIIYDYDSLGRKVGLTDPDIGVWHYNYDAVGNLISQTDAEINEITMNYDELNRIKIKTGPDFAHTFTYDEGTIGTLSSVDTQDYATSYNYDDRLRVVQKTESIRDEIFNTRYAYDSMDRYDTVTLPDGTVIDYDYDNQKNIDSIAGVAGFDYNLNDQVTARDYQNGLRTSLSYDNINYRLEGIQTSNKQDLSYSYESNGNIKTINDDGKVVTYTYDALDRLTQAYMPGEYDLRYAYDSIGNLVSVENGEEYYNFFFEELAHTPSSVEFSREFDLRIDDFTISSSGPFEVGDSIMLYYEASSDADIDNVEVSLNDFSDTIDISEGEIEYGFITQELTNAGSQTWTIHLDSNNQYDEIDENNNDASVSFNVLAENDPVDPKPKPRRKPQIKEALS